MSLKSEGGSTMLFELFINFDGECKEAVDFYAKVFKSSVNNLMLYSDVPPSEGYTVPEADKNRVMYAGIPLGSIVVMFMDMPSGLPFVKGNNITPTVSFADKAEVQRVFDELKEGGKVYTEPTKTFFSDLYASVEDKFGIIWQILHYDPEATAQ